MRMLLLAGSAESVQIARAIAREDRVVCMASLARAGRMPVRLDLPTRIGGWGGEAPFRDWLERERIAAVLDATHPFAVRIAARTARVCADMGVDYMRFLRPPWTPDAADAWSFLNCEAEAERHIPHGARVFLATGQRRLDQFAGLADGRTLHVRVRDLPDTPFPFPRGGWVQRPVPLSPAAEEAALHGLGIDWLVARNTGGGASVAKIEAARRLGIPVAMIRRPPQPEAPRIQTVAQALAWVRRRL